MSDATLFNKYGRIVENGHFIFTEGEIGEQMYIIQEGSVKIIREIAEKKHILAVLVKGDFFGEMSIVRRTKRTATAIAVGEVHLLTLTRESFVQMIEKNAKIALNIIDKLCGRLEESNDQVKKLVKKDVKSLIAMNIYYAMQSGEELYYDKLTNCIATNMGIPSTIVLEKFKNLEDKKIISISGNKIAIHDIEKLKM